MVHWELCEYEEAVEHYVNALELLCVHIPLPSPLALLTKTPKKSAKIASTRGRRASDDGCVLCSGKVLFGNDIAQNSVLGKEQRQRQKEDGACQCKCGGRDT